MTKLFFLGFISIIGFLGTAQASYYDTNAYQVCAIFGSSKQDGAACLDAIRDRQFDPRAVAVCGQMTTSSNRRACLSKIANKRFLLVKDLEFCAGLIGDYPKLQCLGALATSPL